MDLKYTIETEKADEYIDDYVYVHKNEETNEDGTPKYTDKQWVREHILRFIKGQIIRGQQIKKINALEENNADQIT